MQKEKFNFKEWVKNYKPKEVHPLDDLRRDFLGYFTHYGKVGGGETEIRCKPWCVKKAQETWEKITGYKDDPKFNRYTKGLEKYVAVLQTAEYVPLENYGFITTKPKEVKDNG